MNKCTIVADIGINHNGNMSLVEKLIDVVSLTGCDFVKFQKRTVEKVYTKEELDKPRASPWGDTNRLQKFGLELDQEDYDKIYKCLFYHYI